MTGAGVLQGAGRSRMAHQGADGIDDLPKVGEPASPLAGHQERTYKLSGDTRQQAGGIAIMNGALVQDPFLTMVRPWMMTAIIWAPVLCVTMECGNPSLPVQA